MSMRLDVWLDVACLFKTRSEAQKACRNGKVDVNGSTAKPHRDVKPGDRLTIGRPYGRTQTVVVKALAETHVAKAEARQLYDDETPPPTPEELAIAERVHVGRIACELGAHVTVAADAGAPGHFKVEGKGFKYHI